MRQPHFSARAWRRPHPLSPSPALGEILTLKHLGFALEAIRALLDAPAYDLRAALRAQKAALEDDIIRLQGVVYALGRTAAALEQAHAVDWAQVIAVTQALADTDRSAWALRYFAPEQAAWLKERAAATPPEVIAQSADAWQELYAAFGRCTGLPPEHPEVQALAAQMERLIQLFTQGRPEVEQGLAALYQDVPDFAAAYNSAFDPTLQEFMQRALSIYRAQGGNDAVSDC